ncbi:Bidirectional sugar transporter SWEET4 [Zostera marina]|uniref:Bidirectional sugar transporter SWEET n=1 Tax=Zostera marina TaxID=29655 RepID=A0A0K9P5L8_ZOSMR|nr:Bidirectional sugar transporter SWEET4 [Zostera marina]
MVSPDTIRTVVGTIGNMVSLIGMFLSPLPTFWRIWKKKSVEEFSPLPYLSMLMNCSLWICYGIPIVHPNSTLVLTVNGTGFIIEFMYVAGFFMYSGGKSRRGVLLILLSEFTYIAIMLSLVLSLTHSLPRRSLIIGLHCVIGGTLPYISSLSIMKMVIKTKSVDFMSLPLSCAGFANGICWTLYALLRFDPFILIPNGIGLFLATMQLILYGIYYKSTQKQIEGRNNRSENNIQMT